MFTKFNEKGENKSVFSFKIFVGMSNTSHVLLMSSLFKSFTISSSNAGLKDK